MEDFFSKYSAAFDALDPESITALYRLPCAISDADGVCTYSDKPKLIEKFARNCDTMRKFGYQSSLFNFHSVRDLSDTEIAIDVGWRVITANENIDFKTFYICHQLNGKWLVFNANVYRGSFVPS